MINTSNEYKVAINESMRNRMNFEIAFDVQNYIFNNLITLSDNGHLDYSNVSRVKTDAVVDTVTTTLEENMFILDGTRKLKGASVPYQGYVSDIVSDNNGEFASGSEPQIIVDGTSSGELYNLLGMSINFDTINNDYATDFTIEYYNGSTLVETITVTDNDTPIYSSEQGVEQINKIVFTFSKTHNANRRIRVFKLVFGLTKTFKGYGDNGIIKLAQEIEISPIMKEIPKNSFSFTIEDEEKMYDPENPSGIWQYIKENQKLSMSYIFNIDDTNTEVVKGGIYYLEETPATKEEKAEFKASGLLQRLNFPYYGGVYTGQAVTYYDLFENVFDFCSLENYNDIESRYIIDTDLQNYSTKIPLTNENVNVVLQKLCQATGTIIFEDENGTIHVKKANETADSYDLDLKTQNQYPEYSSDIPKLKDIRIKKYKIKDNNGSLEELVRDEWRFSGTRTMFIEYDLSKDQQLLVDDNGVIESVEYYAYGCKATVRVIDPEYYVEYVVKGRPLEKVESWKTYNINNEGEDCEIDLEFLEDDDLADIVEQQYMKYLSETKRYKIAYRGDPSLRPQDIIQLQTRFIAQTNAQILSSKYEYDSGSKGELQLKNIVVEQGGGSGE